MKCDRARELFFEEQDCTLTPVEGADLHAHLAACAACRAEYAHLHEAAAALAQGLRAMTAGISPSPAFWHGLGAGLDAEDAARLRAPASGARAQQGLRARLSRRWASAVVVLAALLAGLFATGNLQHAWADLRHRLYFLPIVDLGQVEQRALVGAAPVSSSNGTLTLTVTELVVGRRVTLLAYTVTGPSLARPGASAEVEDAVDAVLIGDQGRRFIPTYALPVTRGSEHGTPIVRGILAFTSLSRDERSVRLDAARLPLVPVGRPWSVRIPLKTVDAGSALTSVPVDSSDVHQGIRLSVTDLTRGADATVVDMAARIEGGPFAGGSVFSLLPETAIGPFAPLLVQGEGAGLMARLSPLPAPVRLAALPQPEFVFPPLSAGHGPLRLRTAAVGVRGTAAATVRIAPSTAQDVRLGGFTLGLAGRVVVPPSALGMGDVPRLRLTLAFPGRVTTAVLQSVTLVLNGVSYPITRDNPTIDLPLNTGDQTLQVTLEQPLISVQGPWLIGLPAPTS